MILITESDSQINSASIPSKEAFKVFCLIHSKRCLIILVIVIKKLWTQEYSKIIKYKFHILIKS